MVDGSSRLGAFVRILLPLVAPGLVATSVFAFVTTWNEYIFASVLLSDQSNQTVTVWLSYFYGTSRNTDWGGLMAASTLTAIPVVIFFLIVQRKIAFGLTAGAVRGMSGTLERLANGLHPAGFAGHAAPPGSGASSTTGLGGVVLFARNVRDAEQLQRADGVAPRLGPTTVVAIDEEGGDVTRLEASRGSSVPGAARARRDRRRRADRAGRARARRRAPRSGHHARPRARRRRQHEPAQPGHRRPLVRLRSCARLPPRRRIRDGLQAGGVAACAKHFPGHGATDGRLPPRPSRRLGDARGAAGGRAGAVPCGDRSRHARDHDRPSRRAGVRRRAGHAQPRAAHGAAARRARVHRHDRHRCARDAGGERDRRDGGGRRAALARRRRRPLPRTRHRRRPRVTRPRGDRRAPFETAGSTRSGSPRPRRAWPHRTSPSCAARGADGRRSPRSGSRRPAARCASTGTVGDRDRCSWSSSRDDCPSRPGRRHTISRRSSRELGADVERDPHHGEPARPGAPALVAGQPGPPAGRRRPRRRPTSVAAAAAAAILAASTARVVVDVGYPPRARRRQEPAASRRSEPAAPA